MNDQIPIPEYYWSRAKAIIGAFKKGWIAASKGSANVPPYADVRTHLGGITFSRAFIVAWSDGWKKYHAAQQGHEDRPATLPESE